MCPGMDIVTTGDCLLGVKGREKKEYNVRESQSKLQVFIFYPNDWEDDSLSLLSSFSSLHDQFLNSDCCLYGCSTDSVAAHLIWIKEQFGSCLAFPLLSDKAGQLADRFSLFDKEEMINMRGVVITDSKGEEMEMINTSLESEELAKYALNIVMQAGQTPAEAARHMRTDRSHVGGRTEGNKETLPAPSNSTRSGFRSLDHVWSQVVDNGKEAPVIENKRPRPAKIWGPTIGHSHSVDMGQDIHQRPKPGKIWTPPSQSIEQQINEVQKPRAKPSRTWGAPPAPTCPGCGRAVYPVDQVFAADRRHFHKGCIECQAKGCQNKLTARGIHKIDGLNLCGRCYTDRDRGKKVSLPISKVETVEETKQREAKEMQEKKMKDEAMMELKTAIGGGARPSQA